MNKSIQTKEEKVILQKQMYDMMQNITSKQAMEIFKRPAFFGTKTVQETRNLKH